MLVVVGVIVVVVAAAAEKHQKFEANVFVTYVFVLGLDMKIKKKKKRKKMVRGTRRKEAEIIRMSMVVNKISVNKEKWVGSVCVCVGCIKKGGGGGGECTKGEINNKGGTKETEVTKEMRKEGRKVVVTKTK